MNPAVENTNQTNYWKLGITILLSWYFLSYATSDPGHALANWNWLDNVDLIIHEAGHWVFVFFGDFIRVLGGSLLQILVPLVFAGYFLLQRQYYSMGVLLFWVGQNIINVSVYMGDAIVQQLPLLGGDGTLHDWHYLLSHSGLLNHTPGLAHAFYGLGVLFMMAAAVICLLFSLNEELRGRIWSFLHES